MESLAGAKNACDTVVAAFFEVHYHRYRDAFHPKARSPCLITRAYGVGYPVVISNVGVEAGPAAGRQTRAGENVPRTIGPGLVACRWCSG